MSSATQESKFNSINPATQFELLVCNTILVLWWNFMGKPELAVSVLVSCLLCFPWTTLGPKVSRMIYVSPWLSPTQLKLHLEATNCGGISTLILAHYIHNQIHYAESWTHFIEFQNFPFLFLILQNWIIYINRMCLFGVPPWGINCEPAGHFMQT